MSHSLRVTQLESGREQRQQEAAGMEQDWKQRIGTQHPLSGWALCFKHIISVQLQHLCPPPPPRAPCLKRVFFPLPLTSTSEERRAPVQTRLPELSLVLRVHGWVPSGVLWPRDQSLTSSPPFFSPLIPFTLLCFSVFTQNLPILNTLYRMPPLEW